MALTAHQKVLCMEKAERESKAEIERMYEFPGDRHAQEHFHRLVADKYRAMTTPIREQRYGPRRTI